MAMSNCRSCGQMGNFVKCPICGSGSVDFDEDFAADERLVASVRDAAFDLLDAMETLLSDVGGWCCAKPETCRCGRCQGHRAVAKAYGKALDTQKCGIEVDESK